MLKLASMGTMSFALTSPHEQSRSVAAWQLCHTVATSAVPEVSVLWCHTDERNLPLSREICLVVIACTLSNLLKLFWYLFTPGCWMHYFRYRC